MRGKVPKIRPADQRERAIGAIAARQHGLISRSQLVDLGLRATAIDRRIRAGRLVPVHRGVYLVGHSVLPPLAREHAAFLACGHPALVSHLSATRLWKLLSLIAPANVCITVPSKDCRSRKGIRVYRVPSIHPAERRSIQRIPVTSPARTIFDLAATEPERVELAYAEARVQRLVNTRQLEETLERNAGRPGAPGIRRLLAAGEPALTQSEAERRMLAIIREARLPEPQTQVRIGRHTVDFLWRAQGLIVEVDGYRFHSDLKSFDDDRRRDAEMAVRGLRTMRVTWRHITYDALGVRDRLARVLSMPSLG